MPEDNSGNLSASTDNVSSHAVLKVESSTPSPDHGAPHKQPSSKAHAQTVSETSKAASSTENGANATNMVEKPDVTIPTSVEGTPKRKRGRPRKDEARKAPVAPPSPNIELTPRRSERRAVLEKLRQEKMQFKTESDDEEDLDSEEESDAEFSSEDEQPKKRKRAPRSPAKTKASPTKTPKSSPRKSRKAYQSESDEETPVPESPTKTPLQRRTKKGRPSKQERVTQNISSIFQMDDHEFFFDRNDSKAKESDKPEGKEKGSISLNFENNGQSSFSGVPTISGIKNKETAKKGSAMEIPKFEPLPIPEVDADGNIADPGFIEKHLGDIKLSLDSSARLTDERAFFLEGSEGYFEQHSLRFRPSASSLTSHAPSLDYEELIPIVKLGQLIHKREKEALHKMYQGLYHQWCFELSQGYSLNFYGVGSKANLMMEFAHNYLFDWYDEVINDGDEMPGVMVINGYNPNTKLKSVLHDIVSVLVKQGDGNVKMPKHVSEVFPFLLSHLKKSMVPSSKNGIVKIKLIMLIHNIDGEAFRDERSQNFLSQLAALPNVWLVTSTDNINSSLLWDLYRFKNFNFLWHDVTTYETYEVETSFKDILSMGRSKKFVGSKGVKYVLTSLTANAKKLYKVLLEMQLKKLEESTTTTAGRTGLRPNLKLGMLLRDVYDRCVEEYIANNEINFKTMLGEYVEHKMCTLSKNAGGVEIVFVPFTYDEMEKLLGTEFQE